VSLRHKEVRRRGARRAGAALTAAVLAGAALTACSSGPQDAFVTRQGAGFAVDGQPFRFVGFSLYDAAANDRYACSPATRMSQDQLTALLRRVHDESGATVVRFWAYQTYTDGGRDFTGVDKVLTAARAAGMRALPVLEDGPGNCTTGENGVSKAAYPDDAWYTAGYKTPYGSARISYRDYVRVVAEHYRDDPTVLGWMMMNEAETNRRVEGDRPALADFARDVSGVIRAVDTRHLITLGTQSNGAPGASGRDFATVYSEPGLDFAEVHDWARYGSDDAAMPGSTDGRLPAAESSQCESRSAQIACSFAWAPGVGKPLVVGEAGIAAGDPTSRTRRAQLLQAKMTAAFAAGADGYLVWHLSTQPTDTYDVIPDQHDPLLATMLRVRQGLGR
jgi:mannan endo-1,4-beta-mannosidase